MLPVFNGSRHIFKENLLEDFRKKTGPNQIN